MYAVTIVRSSNLPTASATAFSMCAGVTQLTPWSARPRNRAGVLYEARAAEPAILLQYA